MNKQTTPKHLGLSALELTIAIAIVAVIMVIAWPFFQKRRAELLGTDLRQAVEINDRDAILKYLKLGANPDVWSGATPHYCLYCVAIHGGDVEMLRYSVTPERLASFSLRSHCPPLLVMAIEQGNTEMTDFLLASGARPTERPQCQPDGISSRYVRLSPLATALEMNDTELLEKLLAHVTDTDLQTPDHPDKTLGNDSTLLHSAVRSGNPDWVSLLLERGVPVDATERMGGTALHEAARQGDRTMIELLLANGANAGQKDTSGSLPIDKVPARLRSELAPLLGEATPNATDH